MPKIIDLPEFEDLDGSETIVAEKAGATGRALLGLAMQAIFGDRLGAVEQSLEGKQASSEGLSAFANLPILENAVVLGGDGIYQLLATSLVGRTVLSGTALQGRQALNAQVASPMGQALADLGTVAAGGFMFGDGDNRLNVMISTAVGRAVLGGTEEQARIAIGAASSLDLARATLSLGDATADVTDGGSQVLNGGVAAGPMHIIIPAGEVGNTSYIRMAWLFNGSPHAGKTFRFRLRLATSAAFDRALIYQMSVATAGSPNVDRAATISTEVNGTQIVVNFDYVMQGDETAIRPFMMINPAMSTPVAQDQFFRFIDVSARITTTTNAVISVADENMAFREAALFARAQAAIDQNAASLRDTILSQTIIRPSYAEIIRVKPSGGHFTTLSAAVAAIGDSAKTKQYKIAWSAGALLGTPDFHVPQWTAIVCQDPRDDAIMSFANPNNASAASIENTSLLWIERDGVVIEGGTWRITNGRYVFHWETNGQRPGTMQRLIGLKAEHVGNADAVNNIWVPFSQYAAGCGVSAGQVQIVEDCDLRGPGGGFSTHSPNGGQPWDAPFRIHISGTRLEATNPAHHDILLKPIALGPGCARLTGCSYDDLGYFASEWVGGDPGATVNCAQIAVTGSGNSNLAGTAKPAFVNGVIYGNAAGKAYAGRFTGL